MTDFFVDQFSTGSNTALTAHTSDSGHSWVQWYSAASGNSPVVYTSGGGVLGCSSDGKDVYRASIISPTVGVTVSGTFRVDANAGYSNIGWCVGLNAAVTAGYLACYDLGSQRWQFYKMGAAGAVTLLAQTAATPLTVGATPTYAFSRLGTADAVLKLDIGGVTVLEYTDVAPAAAFLAAGYIGYWCQASTAGAGIWVSSMVGTDSAAAAATALTMSLGATSGAVGVPSEPVTFGANGTITGTVVVTPDPTAGTWTPTTVSISAGTPTATATCTPATAGVKVFGCTNDGGLTNPATQNYTASASGIISGATLYNAIRFSPFNWEVTSAKAKTWHPGAYFKTIFDGATCSMQFNVSGMGTAPQLVYRVDGTGPWVQVTLAANIAVTIPTNVANSTRHYLEVRVKVAGGANCWTTDFGAVILTSITIDAGGAIRLPLDGTTSTALFFGDSITNGDLTVQGSANDSADAMAGWAFQIGEKLNSDFGICAFGSTKWFGVGGGGTGIPGLSESYNLKSSGVARTFTGLDLAIINMGTNDATNVTVPVTDTLNGLLAVIPAAAKIIVMRPFNGSKASEIQAGIAACSAPARVSYLNTTGFLDTAFVDGSGLHPLAFENVSHIVPQVLPLVAAVLNGAPSLTTRTVSITLGEVAGAAANLTGAMVAFYDEPTPNLYGVPRHQTAVETTDASGVLTFTCGSTLAVGGLGGFVLQLADGRHFNGTVAVA